MNIYEAIADIMKEGYAISKSKRNQQQGFMYRGIDDVMNTFQPLMAERGIFLVPEVINSTREERQTTKGGNLIYSVLTVKYTFYASDGSSVSATVIGEGMDSGDKASNKAMAVAMKYAMFQVFCIPTEEMQDPDGETPPPNSAKKPEPKPDPKPEPKPDPKPEPKKEKKSEPNSDMMFKCENCGKVLTPYIGANGKMVAIRAHAEGSKKKFGGKVLCIDCIEKMNES